jgi:hypothetical protein
MCHQYGVQNSKLSSVSDRPTLDTRAYPSPRKRAGTKGV